jgi:catechol 2,3-dioxygenase-like lactoylglutathione lyase family enzyme
MPLTQMEHFLVLTDDIDATRDFYVHALGMTVGPRPPLEFPGYWMYVGNVPCVHIGDWKVYQAHSESMGIPVSQRARGTGPLDHIAFNGSNYAEVTQRLERHAVHFASNTVPGIGLRQLFLEDPNGVKIEINIAAENA